LVRIYHNPQCKKSRLVLEYIRKNAKEFEVIEYLKIPFTDKTLEKLLVKLNKRPVEIVRTQEGYFKRFLKGMEFEDYEWIRILVENPKLIMRPIVETDYKAVIGYSEEDILPLLTPHSSPSVLNYP